MSDEFFDHTGYRDSERVTQEMMSDYDASLLVCEHSRIVTDRGVHVCPILIESSDSILGQSLANSLQPYRIQHGACFTCYQYGSICSNPSSGMGGSSNRQSSRRVTTENKR